MKARNPQALQYSDEYIELSSMTKKHKVLHYLNEYNSNNNLSTNIHGYGAYDASMEAAISQGYEYVPHHFDPSIVLQRSFPIVRGSDTQLLDPQDPYKKYIGRTTIQASLDETSFMAVNRLKGAYVENWLDFHLVSKDGHICADASSNYWPVSKTDLATNYRPLLSSRPPAYIRDNVFVAIGNNQFENLCHFIYDFLPMLSLVDDICASVTVLIEKPTTEFHDYFIRIARLNKDWEVIWLEHGQNLLANNLFYVTPTRFNHPLFRCSSWAVDYVRSLVRFDFTTEADAVDGILYIRRGRRRKLLNEDKLFESMLSASISYSTCDLESLSVPNKIRAFTSHRTILSPYGAGNTFVLFKADLPQRLIEILPDFRSNLSTYSQVARKVGVDHFGVTAELSHTSRVPDLILKTSQIELIAKSLRMESSSS